MKTRRFGINLLDTFTLILRKNLLLIFVILSV